MSSSLLCFLGTKSHTRTVFRTFCFFCRILISGGYFGPNSSTSKTLSEDQAFIGRLLTIFQCGINYNQHGQLFWLYNKISNYLAQVSISLRGWSRLGKSCRLLTWDLPSIQTWWDPFERSHHNEIKHKTSQHSRGLTLLPGLVQPLVLPEHVEDQQGQGLLHGRQTHHHARGGGEKQADEDQNIRIKTD